VKPIPEIEEALESRVEALGMELVELEWGGHPGRPILRVRVDFPGSDVRSGVTVEDCARVSRDLEGWLDEHPALPERYVLEVSSPGVERPLRRRRDFDRFVGEEVRVRRRAAGATGSPGGWVRAVLEEVQGEGEAFTLRLRGKGGAEILVPAEEVLAAKLYFRWNEQG
jgi:ribosome maturation factor RimP